MAGQELHPTSSIVFVGWYFIYHLLKIMNTKYKLNHGSSVREEDFGLLFYKMQGPRLYFISSNDLISPDFFNGDMTLEEWIDKENGDIPDRSLSEIKRVLNQLCESGVIIEC